jgi:hypothetical protein
MRDCIVENNYMLHIANEKLNSNGLCGNGNCVRASDGNKFRIQFRENRLPNAFDSSLQMNGLHAKKRKQAAA